jgi:tetrapyrrole methylase family protein/MazG family protein
MDIRDKENKTDEHPAALGEFARFYGIIKRLRDPGGCPWDIEQTSASMRGNLIEEAYECVSAIDNNDDVNLEEELGDLLLVLTMIARIKEQENRFTLARVLDGISDKLVRRHPHVFGDSVVRDSGEVVTQWDKIKKESEGKEKPDSILDTIPLSLPPLERALKMQKKAAKVNFDWKESGPIIEKLKEEIGELEHAMNCHDADEAEREFGDILFTIVNIGRFASIDSSLALHRTNEKFARRFHAIETRLAEMGIPIETAGLELMDSLWNSVKEQEKSEGDL